MAVKLKTTKLNFAVKDANPAHRENVMHISESDLMRVRGIGKGYAVILEQVGVNSVYKLAKQNPDHLYENLTRYATQNSALRRPPSRDMVQRWTGHAKILSLAGDIIIDGPGPEED